MSPLPVLLTGAAAGLAAAGTLALGTRPALRALAEPREDDATGKIPYAELPTPAFVATVALLGGLLVGTAATRLSPAALPLWFVLVTIGLLLAAIDARTTWLPLGLTRAGWVLTMLASAVGAVVAGTGGGSVGPFLLGAGLGALVGWAFFGAIWWLSRGQLAFGDVRYAPIVGAAAGAYAPALIWSALLLGAVAGAAYGVVRLVRRRRGPFPYAPAIFAGARLALLVDQLV